MNMPMRSLCVAASVFAFAACSTLESTSQDTAARADDIPAAIAVPSGNRLTIRLTGFGSQIYECRVRGKAAGYDWVLAAPEAVLKDRSGAILGRHFEGPTWEHGDGSRVTGKLIADTAAPGPGDIRWLLLQGVGTSAPGVLAGATYVQRIETQGGIAPSEACSQGKAGVKRSVPYSADYLFYRG